MKIIFKYLNRILLSIGFLLSVSRFCYGDSPDISSVLPDQASLSIIISQSLEIIETNPGEVLRRIKPILSSVNQLKDNKSKAQLNFLAGKSNRLLGRNHDAKFNLDEAIKYAEKSDTKELLIESLNESGIVLRFLGDTYGSFEVLERAIKLAKENNQKDMLARCLNTFGVLLRVLGEKEKSLAVYQQVNEILQETGNKHELINYYTNLGNYYFYDRKLDEALDHYKKAESICNILNVENDKFAGVLNNIGNVLREKNDYSTAVEYYHKSISISRKINDLNMITVTLKNFGLLEKLKGNATKAIEYLKEAYDLADSVKLLRFMMDISLELSQVYEHNRNLPESINYYKIYLRNRDSVYKIETRYRVENLLVKYDTKNKENEFQELKLARERTISNYLYIVLGLSFISIIILVFPLRTNKKRVESQILVQGLLENLPVDIWAADEKGNITTQNELSKKNWGNIEKRNIFKFPEGDEKAAIFSKPGINKALGGEVFRSEIKIELKSETKHFQQIIAPVFKDNKIEFILGAFIEISDLKETEAALRESEQMFRSYFDLPLIGIAVISPEQEWIRFNQKLCEILGYSSSEMTKVKFESLIYRDENNTEVHKIGELLSTKSNKPREIELKRKDNIIITTITSVLPVCNDDNDVQYYVAVVQDISDKKMLENNMLKALDKAEESNRLKNSLLANMSHEVRTPLTAILGFSQLLTLELEQVYHKNFAQNIYKSAKRLDTTLNSIMDFSELDSNLVVPYFEEYDLCSELKILLKDYEFNAKAKGLEFIYSIHSYDYNINVDKKLCKQIIINLIDNAIKYTEYGYVEVCIENKIENDKKYLLLKVKDSGIGIDKKDQKIIFQEFRQLSEGLNRSFEGTGLGLALINKILPLLNTEISLVSEVGKGSVFTVKFPAMLKSEMMIPKGILEDVELTGNKLNTLIIEDNQMNIDITSNYLEKYFEIDHAVDGIRGIELARQFRYDIIFVDINLGKGLDGIQVLKQIQSIGLNPHAPVIALTGMAMTRDRQLLISEGFTDYLAKPFTKEEILGIINKNLKINFPQ